MKVMVNLTISILISLIFFVLAIISDIYYFPINNNQLDFIQRSIIDRIIATWENYLNNISEERKKLVDYNELLNSLNFIEKNLP